MSSWLQDKGHRAEVAEFCRSIVAGGPIPIPFRELAEVTQTCFEILAAAEERRSAELRRAA
jgi:hypothetical protein